MPETVSISIWVAGFRGRNRQALVDRVATLTPAGREPYLNIEMPCGYTISYPDPGAYPLESQPCGCGDPSHWYVWYDA